MNSAKLVFFQNKVYNLVSMEDKIAQLQKLIDESSNIVFFGGAGVSTESGIPDFRSVDGLYHQKWDYVESEHTRDTWQEEESDRASASRSPAR